MTEPKSDRAEQAKALIDYALTPAQAEAIAHLNDQKARDYLTAELARLQQGIDEALEALQPKVGSLIKCDVPGTKSILERLSQPTTDTNGAHA